MIREAWRFPASDDEMYERGWQVSAFLGLSDVRLGWCIELHPSEGTFILSLGPLHVWLWWSR